MVVAAVVLLTSTEILVVKFVSAIVISVMTVEVMTPIVGLICFEAFFFFLS